MCLSSQSESKTNARYLDESCYYHYVNLSPFEQGAGEFIT